ncbi:hypothetical protein [Glycomyces dulcitolivorans]|uniref:hypothetical protein n=1 Tax=Glycomyces dulcitolivorans TaxID=2200759 RepID=UPI000DD4A121|nr:hypothetical protein [Glycomyces dulcitolivorans]
MFEIGFEDQGSDTNDPAEFDEQVGAALARLRGAGLPDPVFIVVQTGTKVLETVNVGALGIAPFAVSSTVRELAAVTRRHGVALKAHNCDYLTREQLGHLERAGVDALNVAPEFGVVESRALAALLRELGLNVQLERFLALSYESRSWEKWMRPGTRATDTDRALISGHYVFATDAFRDIKAAAVDRAERRGIDLDARLRDAIAAAIASYLAAAHGLLPLMRSLEPFREMTEDDPGWESRYLLGHAFHLLGEAACRLSDIKKRTGEDDEEALSPIDLAQGHYLYGVLFLENAVRQLETTGAVSQHEALGLL